MKKNEEGGAPGYGRERCLALLASVPIGRVVYTDQALPAVMPVNFVLDGDQVAIHTAADSTLAAAVRGAVVAFQADAIDPVALTGWWVTVVGRARLVSVPGEATGPSLRPWVHLTNGQYIHITAGHVSGGPLGPAAHIESATG